MKNHIVFLRGINVSGAKKIKMAHLKAVLKDNGLKEVLTYIQSGNLVVQTNMDSEELSRKIAQIIKTTYDFDVPVKAYAPELLQNLIENNPFKGEQEVSKLYYVLPFTNIDIERKKIFEKETFANEDFIITDSCIYLKCNAGYGKAKLNNNLVEKKLKMVATTRNDKTMHKMLELANNPS